MSHQITDYHKDLADGLGTYVVRIGCKRAHVLLDRVFEAERIMLVLTCVWIFATLTIASRPSLPLVIAHVTTVITISTLAVYAELLLRSGARSHDPHAPEYPVKDVFYLLHKSVPKIILALYLLALLVLADWHYIGLLAPLVVYFRLYSWKRLMNALRLRPDPRTRGDRSNHEDAKLS